MRSSMFALAHLGRPQEAIALEQQLAQLRGDLPPVPKRQIAPLPNVKHADNRVGEVLIELDGIHLPESVYRDCEHRYARKPPRRGPRDWGTWRADGHETGPQNTTVFLYGADAEALFRAVEPVLQDYPLCRGARVTIRQEDQERVVLL